MCLILFRGDGYAVVDQLFIVAPIVLWGFFVWSLFVVQYFNVISSFEIIWEYRSVFALLKLHFAVMILLVFRISSSCSRGLVCSMYDIFWSYILFRG